MNEKTNYCPEALELESFLQATAIPAVFKENKFYVLKLEDVIALAEHDKASATILLEGIHSYEKHREAQGKKQNQYVICNQDEPYADEVWETILRGEGKKQKRLVNPSEELEYPTEEEIQETIEKRKQMAVYCPNSKDVRQFMLVTCEYEEERDNITTMNHECLACGCATPISIMPKGKEKETTEEALIKLRAFSKLRSPRPAKECTCTLHQKLTGDGCSVCNPEKQIEIMDQDNQELKEALKAALTYIDAIPNGTQMPVMPGFERDSVEGLL